MNPPVPSYVNVPVLPAGVCEVTAILADAMIASGSALLNVNAPLPSYVNVVVLPAGVCEVTARLEAATTSSGSALV